MKPLLFLFAIWNTISALRFLLADLFFGRACSRSKMGDLLIQSMRTATEPDREKLATAFKKEVTGAINDLQAANELNPHEPAYMTQAEGGVTDMATLLTGMTRIVGSPHRENIREEARKLLLSWDGKSTYPERIYGQLAQLSADEGDLEKCAYWLEKVLLEDESIVETHENLIKVYRQLDAEQFKKHIDRSLPSGWLGDLPDHGWNIKRHEWQIRRWKGEG
jgi:hypothetical protein